MKRFFAVVSIMAILCVSASNAMAEKYPDGIFYNAKIATLDAKESVAGAVAVKDGKFLAVGSTDDKY